MSRPLYEPTPGRDVGAQDFAIKQLQRRPTLVNQERIANSTSVSMVPSTETVIATRSIEVTGGLAVFADGLAQLETIVAGSVADSMGAVELDLRCRRGSGVGDPVILPSKWTAYLDSYLLPFSAIFGAMWKDTTPGTGLVQYVFTAQYFANGTDNAEINEKAFNLSLGAN